MSKKKPNGTPEAEKPEILSKHDHIIETLRNARRGCMLNPADIDMLIEYVEAAKPKIESFFS